MIIDFHTHAYPPAIAPRTLKKLYAETNGVMAAIGEGTIDALLRSMKESGTDRSVILPVATKPSQFKSINAYACQLNRIPGITSFGGIHPESEDPDGEMRQIRDMGLKGIKIHPDYQYADLDSPGYMAVFEAAVRYDLVVVTHSGIDPYCPGHVHCTPDMILRVHERLPELKLVCAHNGARKMADEVLEKLCGENIWFDCSRLNDLSQEQFIRIVEKHGPDRILYATDNPWTDVKDHLARFMACGFDEETNRKILSENALRLLKEI